MTQVAIIGAKGIVGQEILSLLHTKKFSFTDLTLFGREKSSLSYKENVFPIIPLRTESIASYDIAFFCAGSAVSEKFIPEFRKKTALIIDLSSHFRMDPLVPLIVPEVNIEQAYDHSGLIASPNCIAIIASVALHPLHQQYRLKRAVIATYQAASGAGYRAMQALIEETEHYFYIKKALLLFSPFRMPLIYSYIILQQTPLDLMRKSERYKKKFKRLYLFPIVPYRRLPYAFPLFAHTVCRSMQNFIMTLNSPMQSMRYEMPREYNIVRTLRRKWLVEKRMFFVDACDEIHRLMDSTCGLWETNC